MVKAAVGKRERFSQPPVILTFLAPAPRCNQRCPACIIDRTGEPVRAPVLRPIDFASMLEEFVSEGVPVFATSFQGYEVTLPSSWPYLEAVFQSAQAHGIRRSFITNGMLLHKHAGRVVALDPSRIAISLDGAEPWVNDRLRGLPGAFDAAVESIERFLKAAPTFADRLAIASTVYDAENAASLLGMPQLMARLGISRWVLSFELDLVEGTQRPVQLQSRLVQWLVPLKGAAEAHGVQFHTNDELGFFEDGAGEAGLLVRSRHPFDPEFIVRVEPSGHIRVGREIIEAFSPATARRYEPHGGSIVDLIGYRERVARFMANPRRGSEAAPRG